MKIHFFRVLFSFISLVGLPQLIRTWFGVSVHGESRFPKGLMFPRLSKVVSRMVWSFRAWRKLFPE
ncbi:hypothetical protein KZY75_12300 [Prevotella salivae]|uniref:Uncharacterized protein n=1 Tax=Segatella salivae TaxID=228604 RepID=A0AAW4NQZ6_9BACT|nr:hypothetical protein [Segatella salivae]MBW4866784.1 hypothetical protein [Segatella salivae]MBW4907809.1 hypothetical protein [Segatella salivae]MBW4910785.1 hypothetical protein [Segatella salivae]